MQTPEELKLAAHKTSKENKKFLKDIKPGKANLLDKLTHHENDKVFAKINCLDCGYCCKYLGPRITDKDIQSISRFLGLKPSEFEKKYLITDEDNDQIFSSLPCPFIENDNFCSIYEHRPKACRDYPHTHQPDILRKKEIHLKNIEICPAVFEIFENLKKLWK